MKILKVLTGQKLSTFLANVNAIDDEVSTLEQMNDFDEESYREVLRKLRAKVKELKAIVNSQVYQYPENLPDIITNGFVTANDDKMSYARSQVNYGPTLLLHEYDRPMALKIAKALINYFKERSYNTEHWEKFVASNSLMSD